MADLTSEPPVPPLPDLSVTLPQGGEAAAAPTPQAEAQPQPATSAPPASEAQVPMAQATNADAAEPGASPGTPAAKPPELSPAQCAEQLAALFPTLFGPGLPPRPLKLRIQADIQQRAPGVFSRRSLGLFFSRWTTTNAYIKALLASTERFDLDGQPAGEVAPEHKAAAQEEMARRMDIRAQRIAEQRAAQRAQRGPAARDGRGRAGGPVDAGHPVPAEGGDRNAPPPETPGVPRRADGPRPPRPPGESRPPRQNARLQPQDGRHHPNEGGRSRPDGRPPRGDGPNRPLRPAGDQSHRPAGDRPLRPAGDRRTRLPSERPPHPHHEPVGARADAAPRQDDPAARERLRLVRDWQASPLSRANFCALKGITEAALEEALRAVKG